MKLAYHSEKGPTRQNSLSRKDEQELANQGPDRVEPQLYSLFTELVAEKITVFQLLQAGRDVSGKLKRLNSLIWIWVQMKPELVQSNVRILMATRKIFSLNEMAAQLGMNASFFGRMYNLDHPGGISGWNYINTIKIAAVLDARPELMLTVDLVARVRDNVVNWQL